MDSRSVFLFLLSTVTAFLLLVLALSAGGVVLLLPLCWGICSQLGYSEKNAWKLWKKHCQR